MKVIKQFKESLTLEDILKRMAPGDVINLNGLLYLKTDGKSMVNERGTIWDLVIDYGNYPWGYKPIMLWEIYTKSELKWLVRREGAWLINAITVAERGYI